MQGLETRYEDVDLVIVRENTEDLYAGIEHMVGRTPRRASRSSPARRPSGSPGSPSTTRSRTAGGKVTAVHKANIMKLSDGLFLESCTTVAADYDGPRRVRGPASSTTCACSSSEAGAVRRPRAAQPVRRHRLGPRGRASSAGWASRPARTSAEAVRSSSLSTARAQVRGQNKANPTGADPVRAPDAPATWLREVGASASSGGPRRHRRGPHVTYDLGGTAGTSQFADAVIERLGAGSTAGAAAGATA
jgi:isocitrate dehydrogenase (NAD+)